MLHVDKVAEASMESFWERVESGELNPAVNVLRSLGHRPEAVDFVLDPDSYYFPNRRGDRFVKPATASEDQIPILAVENNTTLHFEKPSLHYLQRTALEAAGLNHWVTRDAERAFAKQNDDISSSGGASDSASVYHRLAQVKDLSGRYIESKPSVIFSVDSLKDLGAFCVGITLHELTHVSQSLSDPIWDESIKPRLRRELEAYAVQAQLVGVYSVDYSMSNAMAGVVDTFRKRNLGTGEFEPTDFFVERFSQDPELQKVWDSVTRP